MLNEEEDTEQQTIVPTIHSQQKKNKQQEIKRTNRTETRRDIKRSQKKNESVGKGGIPAEILKQG